MAEHKAATALQGANLSKKPWCSAIKSIQCIKICMNHPRLELSSLLLAVSPCLESLQCRKCGCCNAACNFEPVCNESLFSRNVLRGNIHPDGRLLTFQSPTCEMRFSSHDAVEHFVFYIGLHGSLSAKAIGEQQLRTLHWAVRTGEQNTNFSLL